MYKPYNITYNTKNAKSNRSMDGQTRQLGETNKNNECHKNGADI